MDEKIHALKEVGETYCGLETLRKAGPDGMLERVKTTIEKDEITCEECRVARHQDHIDDIRKLFPFFSSEEIYEKLAISFEEVIKEMQDEMEEKGIEDCSFETLILQNKFTLEAFRRAGVTAEPCPTCGQPTIYFGSGGGGGGTKKPITPEAGHG